MLVAAQCNALDLDRSRAQSQRECSECGAGAMAPKRKSAAARFAQDEGPDPWDPPPQEPPAYTPYAGPLQAGPSLSDLCNIAQTVDSLRQSDLWLLHRMDGLGTAVAAEVGQWRSAEAVHSRAEARIQALATEVDELRVRLNGVEARAGEAERRSGNALADARTAIGVMEDVRRLRALVGGHTQQLEVLAQAASAQVRTNDHSLDRTLLESLRMSLALQFEQVALHLRGQLPCDDIASRIQAAQREALHRSRAPSLAGDAQPISAASSRPQSEVGLSPRSGR